MTHKFSIGDRVRVLKREDGSARRFIDKGVEHSFEDQSGTVSGHGDYHLNLDRKRVDLVDGTIVTWDNEALRFFNNAPLDSSELELL